MIEHRHKPSRPELSAIRRAIGAILAADEAPALLERIQSDPALELSTLLVLDDPEHKTAVHQRGRARERLQRELERFGAFRTLDLLVVTDRQDLIDRDTAFAIVDLVNQSVTTCRLSTLLGAQGRGGDPMPDRALVWHLIGAIAANSRGKWSKRALDLVVAGLGVVLTAPLLVLIALLIRLDSPGPAFLVQERLGRLRQPFPCIKFRTMCHDAERNTGPAWATADDQRITRVGRFLRKSRFDELPQLLNILRGEMSIVGARPIRKYFADQLAQQVPFYDLRFLERPGLTGWAQIKYVYSSSLTQQIEKFKYDYYYIRHRSLALDCYIMAVTLWTVVRMKGV